MRKLWKTLVALTLAVGLLVPAVAPVGAWQNLGIKIENPGFYVCIDSLDFTDSARRQVIADSFVEVANEATIDTWFYVFADTGCNDRGYKVTVVKQDIGPPLSTNVVQSCSMAFGCHIDHSVIRLDLAYEHDELWWGWNGQNNCYALPTSQGCNPDAKTLFKHEFMHALGAKHNTDPVQEQNCTPGYSASNINSGCNTLGKKTMHWNAGIEFQVSNADNSSGYRHDELTFDDKESLRDLYGSTS